MIDAIESCRGELEDLCRRYRVRTLEVFGSAATGDFDPARSDLDFLVDFLPAEKPRTVPDYFGLLHALEDLFGRKVDLVMTTAVRNPYFRAGVEATRQVIYAA